MTFPRIISAASNVADQRHQFDIDLIPFNISYINNTVHEELIWGNPAPCTIREVFPKLISGPSGCLAIHWTSEWGKAMRFL